jgi:phenylalanine-4-hydroxylase
MGDLYELAGAAALRCSTHEALQVFGRIFWFTAEFGVAWENGRLKAYGSGLLSSAGELQAFGRAAVRPFDLRAMAMQDYDYARFQPVVFAADSFDAALDTLSELFATFDDDAAYRLVA